MFLSCLWLIIATTLICFAAWSAKRHSEHVIENVAEKDGNESTDDLPFWSVKFTFIVGVLCAFAAFLSIATLVLQFVSRLAIAGADALGSTFVF